MLLIHNKNSLQVLHSDRVKSWNDNFSIAHSVVNRVLRHGIDPVDPFFLFLVEAVVIDKSFSWNFVFTILSH
jgi:hypothetical protein